MLRRVLFSLLFFFSLSFWLADEKPVLANNKIGIHILEPYDLDKAYLLVNSSGGDWGYVTIVNREDDLDQGKWQKFFDDCRKRHLIPLVRLATKMIPGDVWAKPQLDDLEKWPEFLNSLNWPVKQQIVVIFNEPNHAKEWEGEINPGEYALVLDRLISLLKNANPNFFILGAGLDQAAPNTRITRDEVSFLQEVVRAVPGIFDKLDGWASHSYPNHGFVGLPEDKGRATIRGYEWEQDVLRKLGLKKELPVYITETGWPHQEGVVETSQFYQEEKVALFYQKAFEVWLKDSRVQAVTPFILNYPVPPFDHFSWLDQDGNQYPQFNRVFKISKNQAEPEQVQTYLIVKVVLADLLPTNYLYKGKVIIKNTGQWIMGEREGFRLEIKQSDSGVEISDIKLSSGELVFPGEERTLDFTLKTGTQSAEHHLVLADNNHTIYVFKPWDLKNEKVSLLRQIVARLKLWFGS